MRILWLRPMLYLYDLFIQPRSRSADSQRREFILNTILTGLLVCASIAACLVVSNFAFNQTAPPLTYLSLVAGFWAGVALLLVVSRQGWPHISSLIFVGLLFAVTVYFTLIWNFRLAQAELLFALVIVTAGVLFTAPLALAASLVVAVCLLIIAYGQTSGHLSSGYTGWEQKPPVLGDAIGYVAIFVIIGIVSWLSNRETDRSLRRARKSEAALQKERDNLEIKVAERTRELEELQVARLLELQPFAEFGRIGASLVHEIANPLTAASLHLEELNRQQHSELVRQLQRSFNQLERYLLAARKQIKRQSELQVFSVGAELKQIVHLLTHRAQRADVQLVVDKIRNVKLYGDVVKFDQLVANLLANAVDAAEKIKDTSKRRVIVHVTAEKTAVVIAITDYAAGISPENIAHLFEPFYSTKSSTRSGLGIGLALVKQYVENDFRGSITVTSSKAEGTTFAVRLRGQERRP